MWRREKVPGPFTAMSSGEVSISRGSAVTQRNPIADLRISARANAGLEYETTMAEGGSCAYKPNGIFQLHGGRGRHYASSSAGAKSHELGGNGRAAVSRYIVGKVG